MRRIAIAMLLVAVAMLSNLAWRKKRAENFIRAEVTSDGRFVDMGVRLHVVAPDAAGAELVPGGPPLRILRTHNFGGMVDTKSTPVGFVGPSRRPAVWYCSEDQETVVLHGPDLADRLLVYGSEGAGKTEALSMWVALRALEFTGTSSEIGVTAPTNERAEMVYRAAVNRWPASWFRWVESDSCFYMANDTRVRLVSTHRQSRTEGSRVQGYNWVAHAGDELQDQTDADADIEMRGRSAPGGRYKRINSATAKDLPEWREFRDRLVASGKWEVRRLIGPRSPFIWPKVWEDRKSTLTPREYQRRVLAMDVGPERMLYHGWSREQNLRMVPQAGAIDVTRQVLSRWGEGLGVLIGHDPGKLWHVSIFMKAYQIVGEPGFSWFVVDEVSTRQATIEQHVSDVLARLRSEYQCNQLDWQGRRSQGTQAFVRADPYSESGSSDSSPDRGVYATWRKAGVRIEAAAYIANATKVKVAKVPKDGRINMLNQLCMSESGRRRFFVACDDNRKPAAPKLVEALETMERDVAGRAEMDRKDSNDRSHWPAATGYGLWAIERPRVFTDAEAAV